jgi:hypothetical protein
MPSISLVRRAAATLVASAVTLSLVAAGGAAQAAPADRGATWLTHQLTGGLIHNDQFDSDDYGLTADTVFALKAIGGEKAEVRRARNALAAHVGDYTAGSTATGDPGGRYAGATAKLLVLAQRTGGDPVDFGGVNLVGRLNRLVTKKGPAAGRIVDKSSFGDFSNTIGQVLAVRGLTAARSGQAGKARRFLLEQQCRQGYFRLNFAKLKATHQSCGKSSPADPDATSYAVVQLWRTSHGHAKLRGALRHAVAWLVTQQRRSGAFVGGTSTSTPNTNSTGLAAWALGTARRCSAARAAASWVVGLQVGPQGGGSKLNGQRGAIAYDKAALKAARRDGITTETMDQWRRATSQAAPGLLFRHGC